MPFVIHLFDYASTANALATGSYSKKNKAILFRARDDPLVTIFVSISLHAANIAPRKCLADSQTNELLSGKDVRDDLGLQLRRTKVEDGRQTDHAAGKQTVHVAPCATARKLRINDELGPHNQIRRETMDKQGKRARSRPTSWKWSNSSGVITPPRSVLPFRCFPGPRRMPIIFVSLRKGRT